MGNNEVKTIRASKGGIDYTTTLLKRKKKTVTKAIFWKIPRSNPNKGFALKIGRYQNGMWEDLENKNPKSELTLDQDELTNLMKFIDENYAPLRQGAGKYIKADSLDDDLAAQLQTIFNGKNASEISNFLIQKDVLSADIAGALEYSRRKLALTDYERALDENRLESYWQKWFEDNSWILGNEFVRVLDDRNIDTKNIADYLVETFDGFVDIIEIKRPDGNLEFWASNKDHDNLVPSMDLIKAITQTQNYIQNLEEEINSAKTLKRLNGALIVKPRATLIFGRSKNWGEDENKAFRILNASYKDLTILTYDQVLARARRTLSLIKDSDIPKSN